MEFPLIIWEHMGIYGNIYIYTYRHMEFPPIITIYVELASSAMEHLGAISINCTVIGVGVSLQDGIVMHCKQLPIGIKLWSIDTFPVGHRDVPFPRFISGGWTNGKWCDDLYYSIYSLKSQHGSIWKLKNAIAKRKIICCHHLLQAKCKFSCGDTRLVQNGGYHQTCVKWRNQFGTHVFKILNGFSWEVDVWLRFASAAPWTKPPMAPANDPNLVFSSPLGPESHVPHLPGEGC